MTSDPQSRPRSWSPDSWRALPADQQPDWPDPAAVEAVLAELRALPPLVFAGEARQLRRALAEVAAGRGFLLHVGRLRRVVPRPLGAAHPRQPQDHAADGDGAHVRRRAAGRQAGARGRTVRQAALQRHGGRRRRGAALVPRPHGQRRRPRGRGARAPTRRACCRRTTSRPRGSTSCAPSPRAASPTSRQVHLWNQEFVARSAEGRRYERIARGIDDALRFMAACGIDLEREHQLHEVDLYTSHEGLVLPYEESLSRRDSITGDWYDCSAHLLWIGERTRDPDHAHVEFFSGVQNPLACKVGPEHATAADLVALCDRLDPDRDPGRLTLIARLGADKVESVLPPLIRAVRDAGHPVVWACDPMHGNGVVTDGRHQDPALRRHHGASSAGSSPSAAPRARGPAASISSSPATTSPSASAAPSRCPSTTSAPTTRRSSTRGSTPAVARRRLPGGGAAARPSAPRG